MDAGDAQVIELSCSECEGTWRSYCYSGRINRRIERFALVHLHRDEYAFQDPHCSRPSSEGLDLRQGQVSPEKD